jgi:hypothetical protein
MSPYLFAYVLIIAANSSSEISTPNKVHVCLNCFGLTLK